VTRGPFPSTRSKPTALGFTGGDQAPLPVENSATTPRKPASFAPGPILDVGDLPGLNEPAVAWRSDELWFAWKRPAVETWSGLVENTAQPGALKITLITAKAWCARELRNAGSIQFSNSIFLASCAPRL